MLLNDHVSHRNGKHRLKLKVYRLPTGPIIDGRVDEVAVFLELQAQSSGSD